MRGIVTRFNSRCRRWTSESASARNGFSASISIAPSRASRTQQRRRLSQLAAQMSYRRVVETMREFLPVSEKINHVTVRNRTLWVGTRIDAIELPVAQPRTHYRMDPGD